MDRLNRLKSTIAPRLTLAFVWAPLSALLLALMVGGGVGTAVASSQPAKTKTRPKATATKPARQIIKGKFTLDKILTEDGGKRQLWFSGRTAHGQPQSLVLVSRTQHPELRSGQSYQLAAEVGATTDDYYVLNKALVYFNAHGTTIPVWIMAEHASLTLDLEKYLKMHAPSSDYLVL